MQQPDDKNTTNLMAYLAWPLFGLMLLAFLTAIERQQWFHLKPATGTAVALSHASNKS